MKFLVAIVLLALAVAEANHVPEHTLSGPRFKVGHTYKYDTVINMTAGVLGMSSQVSASVLRAEVLIHAETENDHVLKIQNVRVSDSENGIGSKYADIELKKDGALEELLSTPIRFVMENGNITNYSLGRRDTLETMKIKKSILRSLEMYVPDEIIRKMEKPEWRNKPIMYNSTENTDYGVHISNYIITTSPHVEFPSETVVYNISRIDNCEGEWYPGYKIHHNFQKQGCPEVCRQSGEWKDNQYEAGCPNGFEPHHTPIKRAFSHEHSLSPAEDVLSPEVITTVEVHFAKMYDQDMEVLIRYQMKRTDVTREEIKVIESGQKIYDDLHRFDKEVNVEEIDQFCRYKKSREAVKTATDLLEEIADLIIEGEPGNPIGEKIILLRDIFSNFIVSDFEAVEKTLVRLNQIKSRRTHAESVRRQVWLEMLPLIGTAESVQFIVKYIEKEIKRNVLVWEAKEMLESLPQNIEIPDEATITEMKKLLKNKKILDESTLLHSAVYLSMGRIIGEVCGNVPLLRVEEKKEQSFLHSFQRIPSGKRGLPKCPEKTVSDVIEHISDELKSTQSPGKIAVYIEALTHTGVREALLKVADYAHGNAENLQQFTPRHMTFLRSAVLHALHNIVGRYPEDVMEIVLPIYFNATETPKIRNAAFGVLIRCQPSLAILERIATLSWFEKSREVGSFVTSTLESFGNSSLPCMQLLSHRIKEILPQLRRFDIGMHHAKNHMWTYFDDLRTFGMEGRFEYTPNNESFVPSTLYHALSYTIDSLRDTVFQGSLNIEGLTQEKILEKFFNYLDVEDIEAISHEEDIFGQGEKGMNFLQPRTVEELRLITQQKFFYKSSYYYLDKKTYEAAVGEFSQVVKAYLFKTTSKYSGYFVKVLLPSSYHTIAVAKTLPYPVEFQMRQPVVFALGVETDEKATEKPKPKKFDLHLKPSLHLYKIFTHQMKNLRDCKEVGVYHHHKIGMTYPFQIRFDGLEKYKIEFKYKVLDTKLKNVLYYHTDAGTYAGRKELNTLSMAATNTKPIRTLPTPFKFEKDVNLVGIPPFHIEFHTEDLNLFHQKLPTTPTDAIHMAIRNILNAGWRYKSANISISGDDTEWPTNREATFKIEWSRKHLMNDTEEEQNSEWNRNSRSSTWQRSDYSNSERRQKIFRQSDLEDRYTESPTLKQWDEWRYPIPQRSLEKSSHSQDEEWMKYMQPTNEESMAEFERNARSASRILNNVLSRISHTLNISVSADSLSSTAYVLMEYNHTYDKKFHELGIRAFTKHAESTRVSEVSLNHLMAFARIPDELRYGSSYGYQLAAFRTAVNWPLPDESSCAWTESEVVIGGVMRYTSNKDVLQNELLEQVEDKYFLPETREECLSDIEDENPLSINCIKAMREHSAFNRISLSVQWGRGLPMSFENVTELADVYLKHYYFEHLHLNTKDNTPNRIDIIMKYIDKFVDKPVADWEIRKPSETVTLRRIPSIHNAQPFSSIYEMHEALLLQLTNNSYPARCVLSENYVHTYDLVTYPFRPRDCQYVLTSHCTEEKNFAIILHGTKEIHIHVASHEIVLSPKTDESEDYLVKFNDQSIRVSKPVPLELEKHELYAYLEHFEDNHEHIRVVARKAGFSVLYDGKTISIEVSPTYKGELCGLCGEFDGEELREFRGIDRCLYKSPLDFANSAIVQRDDQCEVGSLEDERLCDDSKDKTPRTTPLKRDEPSFRRNVVIYRGDEVCFSVRPLPACEDDQEPRETERQRIGFHCLPKDDLTAKKMIDEAKWRPLDELRRKSVDHVERVEVPKRC